MSRRGHRCGGREIGYLFGAYKKIKNEFSEYSPARELAGWKFNSNRSDRIRLIYFAEKHDAAGRKFNQGKAMFGSGSGNVAQFAMKK